MARKSNEIKIIWHEPAEKQTSENVQQAGLGFFFFYINYKIIIDKLSASGLTYDEQKVALKKVLFSVSK